MARALRAPAAALLALTLALGPALGPLGAAAAYASGGVGGLAVGESIYYDGGVSTHRFAVDGVEAYCANPSRPAPRPGAYPKVAPVLTEPSRANELRADMWFAYGGPGFDASMWPSAWVDGTPMTPDRYRALSHILIADTSSSDARAAMYGCSARFKDWVVRNVIGFPSGGGEIASATGRQIVRRQAEVPDAGQFDVFMLSTGGATQYILSYSYTPDVTVNFTKLSAEPSITDGNAEYSLAGAEYDIFNARTGALESHIVLDEGGRASLKLKPNEYYRAVETKAPRGYRLNPDPVEFTTGNATSEERLHDDPGVVRFTIRKKDEATLGPAQPGATLEGAEYKLVDANGKTHTSKTNASGLIVFKDIPFGKCTVTETKAPRGYKLDPTPKTYTVTADQMTDGGVVELEPEDDFREGVTAFGIDLVKYKDTGAEGSGLQEPAAGVQFQVISNTTGKVVCTLTTDAYGRASTPEGAWYGEGERPASAKGPIPYDAAGYTVREVASTTPEGYQPAPDWKITPEQMADGATLHYIVDNDFVSTHLQIVKADAASGAAVPLAGFTFQVLDKDRKPVTQECWYPNHVEMSEFTTDASGRVTLPQALKPGTYYIREVAAQAPYLLNGEDVKVVIGNTTALAPVVVATVTDRQATGAATIAKACSEDGSPLEGAEYDVVATMDVKSPDGLVQAVEGEIVGHVATGPDGAARIEGLPLGMGEATYAFVETAPPAGHVLDPTPHEFRLTYQDSSTAVVTAHVDAQDAPTHLIVDKDVEGAGDPLPGAEFALWNEADETPVMGDALDVLAVRAPEGKRVTCEPVLDRISIEAADEGAWTLLDGEGREVEPSAGGTWHVKQGVYTARLDDGDGASEATVKARDGMRYALRRDTGLLSRGGIEVEETDAAATVEMAWSDGDGAYVAEQVGGRQRIAVDGRAVDVVDVPGDTYLECGDGGLTELPALLKAGAEPRMLTTDGEGLIDVRHLEAGTYRLREVGAPEGYLVDPQTRTFTIAEDGTVDGKPTHTVAVQDDYTKVELSKLSIADEAELPGARLSVLDSEGKVVESWTSTGEPHRIERLEPGEYTLVEDVAPKDHEVAEPVPFTVLPTGEVQRIVMHDEPILVSGEVDKRQEIADPTAEATEANGDGKNTAEVTVSEDGSYDYSVDFRSTSSTWVDEFTVTDELTASASGLADLTGITTPVAHEDFDGKMNVWVRLDDAEAAAGEGGEEGKPAADSPDQPRDPAGAAAAEGEAAPQPSANATLSDGHGNPWLSDPANAGALGDDGRALPYDGWTLWAEGVPTEKATDLAASDIEVPEGKRIGAIRLEYGRVERGFTSRLSDWDREDIKDAHDDLDDVAPAHEGDAFEREGLATVTLEDGTERAVPLDELAAAEDGAGYMLDLDGDGQPEFHGEDSVSIEEPGPVEYAPLVVHMRVTDAYKGDSKLENAARVDLYRNGGGDNLEDHDDDRVEQVPKPVPIPFTEIIPLPPTALPQTGSLPLKALGAAALLIGAAALLAIGRALAPKTATYTTDVFGKRL